MEKKFKRKKSIKWMIPFGKIYLKNRRFDLNTVAVGDQEGDN